MGITWKAMPLLSTLAALVIIVHSAEEDLARGLDREYRYELRPRTLDTETPSYDQSWRAVEAVEAEPMMQKTTRDIWDDSPERPLKRRKPARKRKRRPYAASEEHTHEDQRKDQRSEAMDIESHESIPYSQASEDKHVAQKYHETEPLRYRDTQYNPEPTTETPRRLRKRPVHRRNRWTDDYVDIERPLRKRTQRKRPSEDSSVRFTEFGEFRAEDEALRLPDYVLIPEPDEIYSKSENVAYEHNINTHPFMETTVNYMHLKEDKSLSEFSMEAPREEHPSQQYEHRRIVDQTVKDQRIEDNRTNYEDSHEDQGIEKDFRYKSLEKITSDKGYKLLETIREDRPIDPTTLKEILKRSNGTSLSEILQQHNLSLSDLLRGKDPMSKEINEELPGKGDDSHTKENNQENNQNAKQQEDAEVFPELKEVITVTEAIPDNNESVLISETNTDKPSDLEAQSAGTNTKQQNNEVRENEPKIANKRRPAGIRRKLRMRPSINGTHKSQLNRDLMAQTARKYHNSRNITKSKEWKYVIPMMNTPNSSEEINIKNEVIDIIPSITTAIPEETTTLQNMEYENPSTIEISTQTEKEDEEVEQETTVSITQETTTQEVFTTTEKPKVSRLRPPASRMGLRRQAFNNRLKRKRMKQKNSTTESPIERNEYGVDFFGMPNLVSSSEFIARTQTPKAANADIIEEDFTTLDDFMTTEKSKNVESGLRLTRNSSIIHEKIEPVNTATTSRFISTTEETAKFEIEEILNDTRTSARLSRILMERNMTLNELVEHRERGSSHVHLADIFHNASKEPNPPEPFLSKSSIEPMSKETYPLRAILEANLHDSAAKATTLDPISSQTYPGNIPVVMDFGNNVNENGENMGIMSLFNKFTNDISTIEESAIGKDSEGTPYVTTVITVNNTDTNETTARESRVLKNEENNLKHDVVAWSELFELMRKNHENETDESTALNKGTPSTHQIVLQDADGDGLIVLEDLQRLKDFNINTEGKLDINSYEADAAIPGILDRSPSHTRSVTVATASIVGLAMILFLLTYAAFKWKQQRNLLMKKQNFPDDRIPSPVFENRKGHKNNSSTRSISPMLATSNIYTLSTLDSNGKESPDYMWDSLRKPFQ